MSRPYLEVKEENEGRLLAEIKAKKTSLSAFPPRCTLEISWRCNYACKKCGYSKLEHGPDFSAANFPEWEWEDIERVAAEFFPTCRYTQSTLLGEPFFSPQFKRLMELYRRYGVYYRPTTNGSLLNEDAIGTISGVVDWLKCSFDGHTPDLYERLHLNKNFHLVVNNLKKFSQARRYMTPYPWFRIGVVLMRSNLAHLKDYADFVFQELNVDEMEIMALNYANPPMLDEFYWDIPREVNRRIQDLVEHCIEHKYRLRLPFARMPLRDGSWDGSTGHAAAREIAACQPDADNTGYDKYSDEVRQGDVFGNRQTLEKGYIWSNEMRVTRIRGDNGSMVGVCPSFNRPFFKPPTTECGGQPWIKVESCGSCSAFVFGNLKEQSFSEIYNSPMYREVRRFLYERYEIPRERWMVPCRNCLCVDPIYRFESNGQPNVGRRFFPGDDLYDRPASRISDDRILSQAWHYWRENGFVATAEATWRYIKRHSARS